MQVSTWIPMICQIFHHIGMKYRIITNKKWAPNNSLCALHSWINFEKLKDKWWRVAEHICKWIYLVSWPCTTLELLAFLHTQASFDCCEICKIMSSYQAQKSVRERLLRHEKWSNWILAVKASRTNIFFSKWPTWKIIHRGCYNG